MARACAPLKRQADILRSSALGAPHVRLASRVAACLAEIREAAAERAALKGELRAAEDAFSAAHERARTAEYRDREPEQLAPLRSALQRATKRRDALRLKLKAVESRIDERNAELHRLQADDLPGARRATAGDQS